MDLGVMRGKAKVLEYNPNWKKLFIEERDRIMATTKCNFVAHIGSTAIPGLAAKPIIDILLGYREVEDLGLYKSKLLLLGYEYRGTPHNIDDHIFIRVIEEKIQTHKIHLVEYLGGQWKMKLNFRDQLIKSDTLREEYSKLKFSLESKYGETRKEYTKRKDPFIKKVLSTSSSGSTKGTK